ncbi:endonuclease/exonuclease/phosphatase family protein [Croceivirga sp. JEA036]|uniref:endonuclease/exonuclease/phosphatase family protein n=1 Tax=Croceivirga sp. JEA036 TaxID=2721162 RepID=UPI00143BD0B2|nr:endonuclease/exonuclease/phosphatase family protein [Croceivirga sp. JEA036]NJB36913.1 endonuclease/exonuclease/phosphatase family protein [Croceivirga sp. JEA036]
MRILFIFLFLGWYTGIGQQKKNYRIRTVAFYNLENLFDVKNDSLVYDDDRTPEGKYQWTEERYQRKLENIAQVISEIGKDVSGNSPDILGVCEVETKQVLQDLLTTPLLQSKNYKVVHFDSPDERGIDVGLLYKDSSFLPTSFKSHRLLLFNADGYRDYTRDQLVVGGLLDGEQFYFLVNHWPSRSGGETRSRPNRIKAAELTKKIKDSICRFDVNARIIVMGDFNDDPRDDSIKKVLRSKGKVSQLDSLSMFNPMERMYKRGLGTLAYRDRWNLFDQILLTPNLVTKNTKSYAFWKAGIFSPSYLHTSIGNYKGYPFRTYVGTTYYGGFADHFPVYAFLLKEEE